MNIKTKNMESLKFLKPFSIRYMQKNDLNNDTQLTERKYLQQTKQICDRCCDQIQQLQLQIKMSDKNLAKQSIKQLYECACNNNIKVLLKIILQQKKIISQNRKQQEQTIQKDQIQQIISQIELKGQKQNYLMNLYLCKDFDKLNQELKIMSDNKDKSLYLNFLNENSYYDDKYTLFQYCILKCKYQNIRIHIYNNIKEKYSINKYYQYCQDGNIEGMFVCLNQNHKIFNKPNEKDEKKRSDIHYVCENSKFKALELLLCYQTNIKIQDKLGNTPLHYACKKNSKKIYKCLIKFGADPLMKNCKGELPIDFLFKKSQFFLPLILFKVILDVHTKAFNKNIEKIYKDVIDIDQRIVQLKQENKQLATLIKQLDNPKQENSSKQFIQFIIIQNSLLFLISLLFVIKTNNT